MKLKYVEVPCEVEFTPTATFCADGKGGVHPVSDPEHWFRTRFPEGKPEGGRFVGYVFEDGRLRRLDSSPLAYKGGEDLQFATSREAWLRPEDNRPYSKPIYATVALFEVEEEK